MGKRALCDDGAHDLSQLEIEQERRGEEEGSLLPKLYFLPVNTCSLSCMWHPSNIFLYHDVHNKPIYSFLLISSRLDDPQKKGDPPKL